MRCAAAGIRARPKVLCRPGARLQGERRVRAKAVADPRRSPRSREPFARDAGLWPNRRRPRARCAHQSCRPHQARRYDHPDERRSWRCRRQTIRQQRFHLGDRRQRPDAGGSFSAPHSVVALAVPGDQIPGRETRNRKVSGARLAGQQQLVRAERQHRAGRQFVLDRGQRERLEPRGLGLQALRLRFVKHGSLYSADRQPLFQPAQRRCDIRRPVADRGQSNREHGQ